MIIVERGEARAVEAGFPRGVAAPSTVQFVLLSMIAVFTVLYLTPAGSSTAGANAPVPGEVLAYRQRAAESVANALHGSLVATAAELGTVAQSGILDNPDTSATLATLTKTYHRWRGVVVRSATGAPLAARGAEVPALSSAVPFLDNTVTGTTLSVQSVIRGNRATVVTTLPLGGARTGQALAVSTALPIPQGTQTQGEVRLVAQDGTVLSGQTTQPLAGVVSDAGTRARAGRSGALVGTQAAGQVPVVGYAPVSPPGTPGSVGLAVVSVRAEQLSAEPGLPGLETAALVLFGLALGGFLLTRAGVVRPVLRLRADALIRAGGDNNHEVRSSRVREVGALSTAFGGRAVRPRISASVLVVAITVSVLGWSLVLVSTVGAHSIRPPSTVLAGQSAQVAQATNTVRRSLVAGVSELRSIAALSADKPPLAQHPRFRSVYLAERGGRVDAVGAGRPLRAERPLPAGEGLHQENTSGREPIIYGYTPAPGGRVLVGEFNVARLADLLSSSNTRTRIVDSAERTVVDTQAYLAFQPLTDPDLSAAAGSALGGEPSDKVTDSALVTGRPIATDGPVAALHWAVIGERALDSLAVQDARTSAGARAAALLAALIALGCCAWHFAFVIRPLRRIDGGLTAFRQDEVGTIAACLQACRRGAKPAVREKVGV